MKQWKKGGGYIGVTLNICLSLSYLHESSSNLSLHTHYIKRKEKPN